VPKNANLDKCPDVLPGGGTCQVECNCGFTNPLKGGSEVKCNEMESYPFVYLSFPNSNDMHCVEIADQGKTYTVEFTTTTTVPGKELQTSIGAKFGNLVAPKLAESAICGVTAMSKHVTVTLLVPDDKRDALDKSLKEKFSAEEAANAFLPDGVSVAVGPVSVFELRFTLALPSAKPKSGEPETVKDALKKASDDHRQLQEDIQKELQKGDAAIQKAIAEKAQVNAVMVELVRTATSPDTTDTSDAQPSSPRMYNIVVKVAILDVAGKAAFEKWAEHICSTEAFAEAWLHTIPEATEYHVSRIPDLSQSFLLSPRAKCSTIADDGGFCGDGKEYNSASAASECASAPCSNENTGDVAACCKVTA
jgi:hypothetical protein